MTMGTGTRDADLTSVSDDGRTLRGLVCSYGPVDSYQTSWQRGCFAEGLRTTLPALCWSHDRSKIIGKMTAYDDRPDGLYATFRLADPSAVPAAREAQSLLQDGMVSGLSIGFSGGVSAPDPQRRGVRTFSRAHIHEVSIVLRASVPGSRVLALRSATAVAAPSSAEVADVMRLLDNATDAGTAKPKPKPKAQREFRMSPPPPTAAQEREAQFWRAHPNGLPAVDPTPSYIPPPPDPQLCSPQQQADYLRWAGCGEWWSEPVIRKVYGSDIREMLASEDAAIVQRANDAMSDPTITIDWDK